MVYVSKIVLYTIWSLEIVRVLSSSARYDPEKEYQSYTEHEHATSGSRFSCESSEHETSGGQNSSCRIQNSNNSSRVGGISSERSGHSRSQGESSSLERPKDVIAKPAITKDEHRRNDRARGGGGAVNFFTATSSRFSHSNSSSLPRGTEQKTNPDSYISTLVQENFQVTKQDSEQSELFCSDAENVVSRALVTRSSHIVPSECSSCSGKCVGKYQLMRELGQGGFGVVYKVQCRDKTDRKYAMKQMNRIDEKRLTAAMRECEILRPLKHVNIIQFVDAFSSKDNFYVVMELANEGDLSQYIEKKRQGGNVWNKFYITILFTQILSGVSYLHRRRVLHRDLKPSNILVHKPSSGNAQLKIGDFGLSKILIDDDTNTVCGTRCYMPKEAYAGEYSFPSDVWSLGCIFYELCMLKRAFSPKRIDRVFVGNIPKINKISPREENWEDLRNLCDAMLNRIPANRPTCKQIVEQLAQLRNNADDEHSAPTKYLHDAFVQKSEDAAAAETPSVPFDGDNDSSSPTLSTKDYIVIDLKDCGLILVVLYCMAHEYATKPNNAPLSWKLVSVALFPLVLQVCMLILLHSIVTEKSSTNAEQQSKIFAILASLVFVYDVFVVSAAPVLRCLYTFFNINYSGQRKMQVYAGFLCLTDLSIVVALVWFAVRILVYSDTWSDACADGIALHFIIDLDTVFSALSTRLHPVEEREQINVPKNVILDHRVKQIFNSYGVDKYIQSIEWLWPALFRLGYHWLLFGVMYQVIGVEDPLMFFVLVCALCGISVADIYDGAAVVPTEGIPAPAKDKKYK